MRRRERDATCDIVSRGARARRRVARRAQRRIPVEGLTKTYQCAILVTESVVAALSHPDRSHLRVVEEPVKFYDVSALR